ncbi:DUF554 domain-containing protein [Desulfolutivibrio sulfoxidireducens]|uniref:DUF554 domain-containing protein n=1 Tax=Desulfolutivibrio sulfoxidireducens TaxID=2773299 RepID=UPI00159D7110|nr:DUF554 domain-containing protein [Desulfolutivibrio sulfoxidireducens]QLA16469.1 DUF554 family protein [Desulfolutivibrio sulfoxidireducens]QLA19651.1 DUF554 family protein [Desulfolutivibrio sulfoxidireducens]
MIPVGSLTNAAAILAGGVVGLLLHGKFPERVRTIVFQALGLCVAVIGLQMALKMSEPLVVIFSLILGAVAGELVDIETRLEHLGDRVKALARSKNTLFTDGFVTASLIYCVGSMAILGSFDEGLRGDPTILLTKAMLDGFASVALASTYGAGVLFSCVPVFCYQYGLTLVAGAFQGFFTEALMAQITAVGGLLILGIGINLFGVVKIKISNLLPSLVAAVVLSLVFL